MDANGQRMSASASIFPINHGKGGCLTFKGRRDVDGLVVAGRCISGSHEAMASYRVQVIAMAIGVAAGAAAALAAESDVSPREVDVTTIQQLAFSTPDLNK